MATTQPKQTTHLTAPSKAKAKAKAKAEPEAEAKDLLHSLAEGTIKKLKRDHTYTPEMGCWYVSMGEIKVEREDEVVTLAAGDLYPEAFELTSKMRKTLVGKGKIVFQFYARDAQVAKAQVAEAKVELKEINAEIDASKERLEGLLAQIQEAKEMAQKVASITGA